MSSFFKATDRLTPAFDLLYKAIMFLCKVLLVIDILIVTMQVSGRFVEFIPDPAWSEEVILLLMTYMGLMAAALALRTNRHIRMTVYDAYIPKKAVIALDLLADVVVFVFVIVLAVVGWQYASGLGAKSFFTSIRWLSKFWMFFPVPLAGVLAAIFEVELILKHLKALVLGEKEVAQP